MALFYRYSQSITLVLLLTLSFVALPTKADDTEEVEQFYQVEVIVFTPHRRPDTTESWRQIHSVKWPSPLVFLKRKIAKPEIIETQGETSSENQDNVINNTPTDNASSKEPETFYALDSKQFILSDTESYLNRQSYRVLSHQSWLQKISNKNAAPHIVIYGGDHYGEHQTLEGSIQVYVERYLHVDTDLWLIDFSPNVGQTSKNIPILPPRPFNPDDFLTQSSEGDNYSNQSLEWGASGFSVDQEQQNNRLLNIHGLSSKDSNNNLSKPVHLKPKAPDIFDSYLSESQWLPNQIIPLRQHRKMKSGELHYIDHPLFGVLIQVNRYEAPQAPTPNSEETNQNEASSQ